MSRVYSRGDDGVLIGRPAQITAVSLMGGTADSSVILYDHPSSATGTKLITLKAKSGESHSISFPHSLQAKNGVYADISGTSSEIYVFEE